MRIISAISLTLLLSLTYFNSSAQDTTFSRFLTIGMTANSYKGDLSEKFQKFGGGFHVSMRLNRAKRVNSEVELGAGFFTGQDKDYYFLQDPDVTPNNFFWTNYFSLGYNLNINLVNKERWRVFISAGLGLLRFSPRDVDYNLLSDQLDSRELAEDYSNISVLLPTQLGFMYNLREGYGFMVRAGYFNNTSDYIDNVSLWGNQSKKDNVFAFKFSFVAPLTRK